MSPSYQSNITPKKRKRGHLFYFLNKGTEMEAISKLSERITLIKNSLTH